MKLAYKLFRYNGDFTIAELSTRFCPKRDTPKAWKSIGTTFTAHGKYESGIATIYHSPKSNAYYIGRYFDGCFYECFAKISNGEAIQKWLNER